MSTIPRNAPVGSAAVYRIHDMIRGIDYRISSQYILKGQERKVSTLLLSVRQIDLTTRSQHNISPAAAHTHARPRARVGSRGFGTTPGQ